MVRKRRRMSRSAGHGTVLAGLIGIMARRIWSRIVHRPVDSVAILSAAAASLIIITNAVFLQSGSQRGPFVANPTAPPQLAESRSEIAPAALSLSDAARAPNSPRALTPAAAARRNDPIGDLIGSSVGSLRGGRTVE